MSNEVYANGMEVSCKAAAGKSIAAFPDVCFTPPLTPATPPGVPIPYPNTGMASDTSGGSKTVQISGKEVMKKDSSYFKTSTGDEAGSAPKKNVITSKIKGKCFYTAWSMDVKVEGENAVRHLDMMTHNHASNPGATPPWPYQDGMAMDPSSPCQGDKAKKDEACKDAKSDPHCPGVLGKPTTWLKDQIQKKKPADRDAMVQKWTMDKLKTGEARSTIAAPVAEMEAENDPCVKAARCQLKPKNPNEGQPKCCPGQTPHHIPPAACCKNLSGYSYGQALCMCLEGTSQHFGSHGKAHAALDHFATQPKPAGAGLTKGGKCKIAEYNTICAAAAAAQHGCNPDCIKAQLDHSLQPTDREIEHAHSNSNQPADPQTQSMMRTAYKAMKMVSNSK